MNLYCQDESRFGLFTRAGKGVTAKGIKPVCPFQQVFQSTWLFGAYSPVTGDHFHLELPHCSAATFQIFLDHFAAQQPDELKIMLMDNGAFHKAKCLRWPDNIRPLFMPPYSPELNPAEKIWWRFKRAFSNKVFESLDQVSDFFDWTNPTGGTIAVFQPSGLTMLNSILFGGKTDHCSNATITNCIFTRAGAGPIWQSNNSTVSNCIFSSSDIFSNCTGTAINNITDQAPATIFVNETDGHYQFTDDLHLAGGSPGIGAGSDGNDIGIYGTASPYKPGGVPHVPHIRKVDIARSTDASGNLPATVRVAAQPN